jgi:YfiH family protein
MIIEKSKKLTSPHAFSTRTGGVSSLDSTKYLNLGFGRGDDDNVVMQNLEIFAKAAEFDEKSIVSLPQTHSIEVLEVDESFCGMGYYKRDFDTYEHKFADGYVTNKKGITLGVKTADCVPILLEGRSDNGEIIAVGAVHAGWRGTVGGIQKVAVEKLVSLYGVKPRNIYACIGPCIHKCCFEVGEDVYEAVKALGEDFADDFCKKRVGIDDKYMCDLVGINRRMLENAGVPTENIDVIDECTFCNPEKYYSHRYSGGNRGTMLSVIWMG